MARKEKGEMMKSIVFIAAIPMYRRSLTRGTTSRKKDVSFLHRQITAWPTDISWEGEACIPLAVLLYQPVGTNASWGSCPKAVPRPAVQERNFARLHSLGPNKQLAKEKGNHPPGC